MMWIFAAIAIWIACGILAYGMDLAYFQRKFPAIAEESYRQDRINALVPALSGPIGLSVTWMCTKAEYGLMYRKDHS